MNIIKLNCVNCNKEFEKYKGEYDRKVKSGNTNFFCCLRCSVLFQRKREVSKKIEEYNLNPKTCKNCNSIILYQDRHIKTFCKQACAATFNNKIRVTKASQNKINIIKCEEIGLNKKTSIKRQCNFCNIEFNLTKLSSPKKYCSASCRSKQIHEQKLIDIENGVYTVKSNKQYKSYLISKRGHQCEMCKFTEWGGKPILLILDHIDGNSENFGLDNLRIICSNCDTLTPTYKGRNKGNGRFARKQRYQSGKSF